MNANGYRQLIIDLDKVSKVLDSYIERFDSIGETWTDGTMSKTFECLMNAQEGLEWAREIMSKAEAEERQAETDGH